MWILNAQLGAIHMLRHQSRWEGGGRQFDDGWWRRESEVEW